MRFKNVRGQNKRTAEASGKIPHPKFGSQTQIQIWTSSLQSARPPIPWQRFISILRTDTSAPPTTGRQDRRENPVGRCHLDCFVEYEIAAVRCTSQYASLTERSTPKPNVVHPQPPALLPNGGRFLMGKDFLSLRPTHKTSWSAQGLGKVRGARMTLSGAVGVDKTTGAAIQRPVVPGESETSFL